MKIHFDGAAQTVTGSQYLIEVNGSRLLMECGLYQGKRQLSELRNKNFPFNPADIDAVLLSHAHIDHSGNLPNLVKQGYKGPIYATPGSVSLAEIMLRDSGHIHEADAGFINKKNARQGKPLIEPLYTIPDVEVALRQFERREYNREFEPVQGVKVHFVDAGHILGSAAIVLDITENGKKTRLWFSGDIGRKHLPIIKDPVLPQNADYLMMECTYGDKVHRNPEEAYVEFCEVVKRTVKNKGKIIIPAFAVGRTQEIIYMYDRMLREGVIRHIPVFVDSPLAVSATDVFRMYPQYFDEEAKKFFLDADTSRQTDGVTYTRSVEESKAINNMNGPLMIISASGMAETGRILHHLKNNIEDSRNVILIVGWQAPDTLGRRLAEREKKVRIFGEQYTRKADVETIGGLSAHGGQDMLLNYALATKATLKKLFLVHGEERGAMPFMEKLQENGFKNIEYPIREQTFEI